MKTQHLLPIIAALAALPCIAQSTNTPQLPPPHGNGPQGWEHRIDHREANLEKRIDHGISSGKLTTEQAANLEQGLEKIKEDEAKALQNDGKISKGESRQINREANKLSHDIRQAKHPGRHK